MATATERHKELFDAAMKLLESKRIDYATDADPFANFRNSRILRVEPWRGAGIRLMDKLARFVNLADRPDGKGAVSDETLRDTIIDALNYTVIMYQLWEEQSDNTHARR